MNTKIVKDNTVPQVGEWYRYRLTSKSTSAPFYVFKVIAEERRILTKREEGRNNVRSMRFDTLWDCCEKIEAPSSAKVDEKPADMQKMVAMAVATAMAEHERRYHSPQLKLVAEK